MHIKLEEYMRLNIKAFALTVGIMWGCALFFLTWWVMLFEGATGERTSIGCIYRGFRISPVGSVFGLMWGFFDGLGGGAVFAWLYNKIARKDK
jgi:hypothetical protein